MAASAHELLRTTGLRTTAQRIVVLEALLREKNDVTAQTLHARLRRQRPSLGLATVYRALSSLAEAGVIHAMVHGDATCYRACAPGHHHHLTCRHCHTVVEIRDCDIEQWAQSVAQRHGFSDTTHLVELVGICANCS